MAKRSASIGDTLLEELDEFLAELPWWMGPPIAGVAYVLFRFVIPAFIGIFPHPAINPMQQASHGVLDQSLGRMPERLAPWVAGLVLFVWVVSRIRKWKRNTSFNNASDPTYLRGLQWQDFEALVSEYYRRSGYDVEQQDGVIPDGRIHIVLKKDGRTTLVQCKHWKTWKVGVRAVRELFWVISHRRAAKGILVTSGYFTNAARDFAHQNGIELVEGHQLADMIHSVCSAEKGGAVSDPVAEVR